MSEKKNSEEVQPLVSAYMFLARLSGPVVVSLVLLLFRVVWGWQFYIAGRGKLNDISRPIGFFKELGIPFPVANAWAVASVETFGGLMLMAGLGGRAAACALSINMIVAFCTADRDAVHKLFTEGNVAALSQATPFWFLVASLLVWALGPGEFSLDAIAGRLLIPASRRKVSLLR